MTAYENTLAGGNGRASAVGVKRNDGSRRDDGAKRLLRAMTGVSDLYIEEAAQFGTIRQIKRSGEQSTETLRREQKQSAKQNRAENGESEKAGTAGAGNIRRIRRWTTAVIAAAACFAAVMVGVRMGRLSSGTSSGTAEESTAAGTSAEMAAESGTAAETAEDTAGSGYDEAVNPYVEVSSMSEAEAMTGFGMDIPEAEEPYAKTVITVVDQTMIEVDYYNEDETDLGYSIRKAAGSEDISGDYSDYGETETEDADGVTVTMKGESGTYSVAVWTSDGYSYAVSAPDHPLTKEQVLAIVQATH